MNGRYLKHILLGAAALTLSLLLLTVEVALDVPQQRKPSMASIESQLSLVRNLSKEMLKMPLWRVGPACGYVRMNPMPRPESQGGRYDKEYRRQMKHDRPPFLYHHPVRIALCLRGRAHMSVKNEFYTNDDLVKITRIRWSSIQKNVIEPAKVLHPRGDVSFDVFVHTSSTVFEAAMYNVIKPTRIASGSAISAYHSPLHSLWLMWDYMKETNTTYDRVVLLRNDLIFFNPIPWERLHPRLFYLANWCRAIGQGVGHAPVGLNCVPLGGFVHETLHRGVPDFLFSGTVGDMSAVFGSLISDINACRLVPTTSCCAHAIYGGQIERLYESRRIRIGRMLTHHIDFDFHRAVTVGRMDVVKRGWMWIRTKNDSDAEFVIDAPQEWVPRRWSTCPSSRAYCYRNEFLPPPVFLDF